MLDISVTFDFFKISIGEKVFCKKRFLFLNEESYLVSFYLGGTVILSGLEQAAL